MATFILTAIGDDRPGLVSALSAPINEHGASWERSEMARLAGKFAGIVVVSVADAKVDALVADLTALNVQGLHVAMQTHGRARRARVATTPPRAPGCRPPGHRGGDLRLARRAGREHRGAQHRRARRPHGRGTLFEARAVLNAPSATSTDELRSMLEGLADELMVEIQLSDD